MNLVDNTFYLANGAAAGATYTSNAYPLNAIRDYSIHVVFSSATLNGTLTVEASNDTSLGFFSLTTSSVAIASGVSNLYNISGANYKYVRLVWTYTSGAGTLTAVMTTKGQQG